MFADTQTSKTKINTSKIKFYTGMNSRRTQIKGYEASKLISYGFTLQKDTRTWNQV